MEDNSAVCHLCGVKVIGDPLRWDKDGVGITGALMTHLNLDCPYVKNYNERVVQAAESWKE
jgi:hypothetical protein